ncbi:MAG: hypothetical protein HY445_01710 [Candidatus Niyogibacteria bacterium]|nr:hypothetical protein [Candidatus Niyogibacteria bacterium]
MKNIKQTSIIVAVFIIFVFLAGVYFYLPEEGNENKEGSESNQPAEPILRNAPAGWLIYKNASYGFSLFYPEGLDVKEFDEGGGAGTITFEDAENALGFQIFIVPYAEAQVTEERFLKDNPSGVKENFEDITVDGAVGATFVSRQPFLGETREVWFIHDGYLFEVTILKPTESFLADVLSSWKF